YSARLARPVDQVAVLVEHHGGAAEHGGALAGEATEPVAFEQQLLAPEILHDGLLGQRQPIAGAFAGAHDLWDVDVGFARNEQFGTVVVEKAVGAAARCRDRFHGVEDVECRTAEYWRRLHQWRAVGLFENTALDEAVDHQLAIARWIGRVGDLLGAQHG